MAFLSTARRPMVRAFHDLDLLMLASFRRLANTWPARILLLLLGISFASWGIADVARRIGAGSDAVASVQGHDITPAAFMEGFQSAMRQYAEQFPDPTQIPQALRMRVASQTLQQLVTQQALADQAQRMGVVVPDSQVRDTVFAMSDFQGPDGKFSRNVLLQTLSSHNMSEAHFLDLVRQDIRQNQLIRTVAASASAPDMLTALVFKYLQEKRRADILVLPLAGQPLPAPPTDAALHRFYENHPGEFTSPEYRHIKAVILSPESIGRSLNVAEADLRSWFEQHKSDYVAPEKRTVQVITTDTEATATALAAQWRTGASWDAIQAAATAAKATSVPLDNATRDQIPSPELAQAVFAAPQGTVVGPVKQALGYYVLRVTGITSAQNPSFESLHDVIHGKVAAERALDLIDARAQKLQDLFAGGAKIDEVPAELGATGAEGTLDSKGNTPQGTPAPLPATPDLRKQIIDAAFTTKPGDPITPTEGPGHAWFAVTVDSITKPARKPFDQVRDQVLAEWQRDQVHHQQETEAAHLLTLVKAGQTLTNAAWGSGMQVTRTPPLQRGRPQDGLPAELIQTLFTLKAGEATMAETDRGFVVAQLAEILPPDPKADSAGLKQTHDGLDHALHDDYLQLYAVALRDEAKPTVRPDIMEKLIQPQAGE